MELCSHERAGLFSQEGQKLQASLGTVDFHIDQECRGVSLMRWVDETELIFRASAGDIEAKLQLVKMHLDLVVEMAAAYTSQTGRSFSQMIQAGASAVIRAADEFQGSQQIAFVEHLRYEIAKTMEGIV
jgi:DNA-directed RNA polymerase sigma subunit (sigma70/sigma32)